MMQNEIHTEQPEPPQTLQTEADAQAARLVTERLNKITTRANQVATRTVTGVSVLVTCLVFGLALISFFTSPLDPARRMLELPFSGIILIMISLTVWNGARAAARFDVDEIARLGGTRAIEPLCATLTTSMSTKQRRAIHNALIRLLPQIKASDANALPPLTVRYICSFLRLKHDGAFAKQCPVELRVAALKALEQVGDSRAIPTVERLTKMKRQTKGRTWVKQAAIECLPMLLARCEVVETAQTLLRASAAGEARPDTLLRPANGAGNTDAAELLRGSGASNKQE